MQPNFDLTNRAGITQAINWIAAQTQPETVSNVLIAQVNAAIMAIAPDLANLTSVDKRRIKNAVESIMTGGFNFYPLPESYPVATVDFEVLSSNLPTEIFTLDKSNSGIRYALGEAGYELKNVQELVSDGLQAGEYYQVSLLLNGQMLFGRNLGNVPAGTSLGVLPAGFNNGGQNQNIYLQKLSFGQDLTKFNIPTTVTNNSTQNIDFAIVAGAQYFGQKDLPFGNSVQNIYNIWNYFYLQFKPKTQFTLTQGISIDYYKNGDVTGCGYQQFVAGSQFYPNNNLWIGQAYGFSDGDTLEVVISDI